ncbi:MAG: hypothetical protein INR63_03605 [Actinomycetospora chiangmaiensis]|nr:hypothetical protein [Actinomycetospora chiangmaiensis]
MESSPLAGLSFAYLDALQAAYAEDPTSVEPSWRALFQILAEVQHHTGLEGPARSDPDAEEGWRSRGHLTADLDPLNRRKPQGAAGSLRRLYTGTLAAETGHLDDAERRAWLHA